MDTAAQIHVGLSCRMSHASTQIVIEPTGIGETQWVVRFAAREDHFALTTAYLRTLSAGLEVAGSPC
jgi:hypothetical protein